MEIDKKEYQEYIKTITPVFPLWKNMLRAFVTGGAICTLGQGIRSGLQALGAGEEQTAVFQILALIVLSVVLTGLGVYPKLVQWGGAGALVPITGFANSVAAPAIENQAEGDVFGVGCKIFTISGPVILYGVLASWVLGLLYWAGLRLGIFL